MKIRKKACPDCRQPMNDKTIHKIFLKMDDNQVRKPIFYLCYDSRFHINIFRLSSYQLLLTGLNDIRILFNGQEKKNDNMFKTLTDALEKITVSMSALEYQNELLRKENKEQKQMGAADGNSKESSSMKEQMKAKDFMVANLQKEVNDLKSQRAETTREMNSIREQINHLKATAKGEKRDPLKDANEQKPKKLTLTFDNVSDKL